MSISQVAQSPVLLHVLQVPLHSIHSHQLNKLTKLKNSKIHNLKVRNITNSPSIKMQSYVFKSRHEFLKSHFSSHAQTLSNIEYLDHFIKPIHTPTQSSQITQNLSI